MIIEKFKKVSNKNIEDRMLFCVTDERLEAEGILESAEEVAANVSMISIAKDDGSKLKLHLNRAAYFWQEGAFMGNRIRIRYIPRKGGYGKPAAAALISAELSSLNTVMPNWSEKEKKLYLDACKSANPFLLNGIIKQSEATSKRSSFEEKNNEIVNTKATSESELKLKFALFKDFYPIEHRNEIERLLGNLDGTFVDREERNITIKRLMFMVNFVNAPSVAFLKKNIGLARKELDLRFPGQKRLKDVLLRNMQMFQKDPEHKAPVFIISESPGMEITTLIEEMCTILSLKLNSFSLAGEHDLINITGSSTLYANGNTGALADTLVAASSGGALIIKGIDKAAISADVMSALHPLVEDRLYRNELLSMDVDVSCIPVFIVVSNRNRLTADFSNAIRLDADDYSEADMERIVRLFIERTEKNMGLPAGTVTLGDDAIKVIASKYIRKNNASDAVAIVKEIICNADSAGERKLISAEQLPDYYPLLKETEYYKKTFIKDPAEMENKLRVAYEDMDADIREAVERMLEDYKSAKNDDERSEIAKRIIIGNLLKKGSGQVSPDFCKRVTSEVCGMDMVIEEVEDQIYSHIADSASRMTPLLLVGPPGIGKTAVCRAIARHSGKKAIYVNFNSLSDSGSICGSRAYGGLFSNIMEKEPLSLSDVLVQIDEFDHPGSAGAYLPFFNILDNQSVYSEYYHCSFCTDGIMFILTANSLENIPIQLVDRCRVIKLRSYSRRERVAIAENYIVPKLSSSLGIDLLSKELIEYVTDNYSGGSGIRELEKLFERVYKQVNKAEKKGLGAPIVDKTYIDSCLVSCKPIRLDFPPMDNPGRAIGIAVSMNGEGFLSTIDICRSNSMGDKVTGLVRGSFMESITRGKSIAERIIGKSVGNIMVDVTPSAVEKDGASAGAAIVAAMVSFVLNRPIGKKAILGEVDLFGNIYPVGGVNEKLNAAVSYGLETVFIPLGNYEEARTLGYLEESVPIKVIPVKSTDELFRMLFPGIIFNSLKETKEEGGCTNE